VAGGEARGVRPGRSLSVDSASLHEVVRLLREPRLENRKEWERESAVRVTALLIGAPNLTIAPAPTTMNEIIGPFEQFARGLDSLRLAVAEHPSQELREMALIEVQRWGSENPTAVASGLASLKADPEFTSWMDVSAGVFWQEHAVQHDGLFDLDFVPQISSALAITQSELLQLHRFSQNIDALPELASRRTAGSPGAFIADAYVISALLRGRYHDLVNYLSDGQLTHHAIREAIALDSVPVETDTFPVTNTMSHLGALLLASAFVAKGERDRIRVYLENLDRLKKWIGSDYEALRAFAFGERLEEEVVHIADKAGIDTRGSHVKSLLEAAAAAGLMLLTSFVLLPWGPVVGLTGGAVGGLAGSAALEHVHVGERVGEGFRREQRLRDLHKAGSGLVRSKWRPPEAP
jgi:hypothetical protein